MDRVFYLHEPFGPEHIVFKSLDLALATFWSTVDAEGADKFDGVDPVGRQFDDQCSIAAAWSDDWEAGTAIQLIICYWDARSVA